MVISSKPNCSNGHHSKRILVVDDDEGIRETLKDLLEFKHYSVSSVKNGKEAIEICSREHFDKVLMDVRMPEMDGMEALNILHGLYPNIDVYMMSAYFSNEQEKMAYKQGAKRVFYKPLNLNKLFDSIQENKANNEKLPYGKRC